MSGRSLSCLLAAAVAGAAAASAAGAPAAHNPLLRPLHVPRLQAGARCPVTPVDRRVRFSRRFGTAPGLGAGPVYPVGFPGGVLRLAPAANFGSSHWGGQKVLWLVTPAYRGPVLIRGARLDGRGLVRFQDGNVSPAQLRIPVNNGARGYPGGVAVPAGTRYLPSYTRVREPGCYAYQIDGTDFSRVVVFRAVP